MAPALNLDKLAVEDAEFVPTRRGRQATENPFIDVVKDSYDNEQGKSVRVPHAGTANKHGVDENVVKVVNMIRAAARYHEIGVSVQIQEHSKTLTDVLFLAKDRRAYTPQEQADEDAANDE